jgi:hypothetical protein
MTDQADSGTTAAETMARPTTYHGASRSDRTWLDARDRYDELIQRDLSARVRVTLVEMGEYDPVKHGSADPEPLTLREHLEVLANGEVVARVYRHPAQVDRALQAGATWEQIADARGCDEAQARQEYREWAEGQHGLWTGQLGGEPGRLGMNDAEYAAAIARANEPDPGAAKAYAATHRVLCAHADDDGQGAHWLAPGEKCTRGRPAMEPDPAEVYGFGRNQRGPYDQEAGQ